MAFTPDINYVAIVVAAVAYFFVGFVWYTPLFGKRWASEAGMDPNATPEPAQMAKSMGLNMVGNLLLVFVFAHILEAFTERAWDPAGAERSISLALQGALWVWLGFAVPKELSGVAWEKRSWTFAAINLGHAIVGLSVVALILTAWPW